jgi:hypothetical protein
LSIELRNTEGAEEGCEVLAGFGVASDFWLEERESEVDERAAVAVDVEPTVDVAAGLLAGVAAFVVVGCVAGGVEVADALGSDEIAEAGTLFPNDATDDE